jgi:hypothetical protein
MKLIGAWYYRGGAAVTVVLSDDQYWSNNVTPGVSLQMYPVKVVSVLNSGLLRRAMNQELHLGCGNHQRILNEKNRLSPMHILLRLVLLTEKVDFFLPSKNSAVFIPLSSLFNKYF